MKYLTEIRSRIATTIASIVLGFAVLSTIAPIQTPILDPCVMEAQAAPFEDLDLNRWSIQGQQVRVTAAQLNILTNGTAETNGLFVVLVVPSFTAGTLGVQTNLTSPAATIGTATVQTNLTVSGRITAATVNQLTVTTNLTVSGRITSATINQLVVSTNLTVSGRIVEATINQATVSTNLTIGGTSIWTSAAGAVPTNSGKASLPVRVNGTNYWIQLVLPNT